MKRILSMILVITLLCACTAYAKAGTWLFGNGNTCEGAGFRSAQEAAEAYVKALSAGDVTGALSTFTVETFIEKLDTDAYLEQMRGISISMYQGIPAVGPLSTGILIEKRRSELTNILYNMYLYYTTINSEYESLADGVPMGLSDTDKISAYTDFMRNNSAEHLISKISIKGAYLPEDAAVSAFVPEQYYYEQNLKNLERFRTRYNADELQEVIVLLDIGGVPYVQFMQCVRYGKAWYNMTVNSNLAIISGIDPYIGGFASLSAVLTY